MLNAHTLLPAYLLDSGGLLSALATNQMLSITYSSWGNPNKKFHSFSLSVSQGSQTLLYSNQMEHFIPVVKNLAVVLRVVPTCELAKG